MKMKTKKQLSASQLTTTKACALMHNPTQCMRCVYRAECIPCNMLWVFSMLRVWKHLSLDDTHDILISVAPSSKCDGNWIALANGRESYVLRHLNYIAYMVVLNYTLFEIWTNIERLSYEVNLKFLKEQRDYTFSKSN